MSETAIPQPANARTAASASPVLWQTILLRALATLAFGLVTVFWAEPGTIGLCVAFTIYLLALAATQFLTVRALDLPRGDARRLALLGATGLLAMSAVVVAISVSALVSAWFCAAALAALGVAELFSARHKSSDGGRTPLRSDWSISAVLGLGTGLLLPFFVSAGPHGIMGVAGGGALMSGALWMLSALTLRHDAAKSKAQ
ncbi:hypothetical protein AAGW05_08720 [Arthrobacter sp. LAPM80]|uniref:hypothetical protein n=1 Tax=Arthrobacter sp. LAPM80 TaxID=3141788 RepID=UPI00398B994C